MNRDRAFPPSPDYIKNAKDLLAKLTLLEAAYGHPLVLTGGYRPKQINFTIPNSRPGDMHESCEAVDLRDSGGSLSKWCMANLDKLETIGLWLESPTSSVNHVHLQIRPPRSGRRVFIA